MCIRDRDTCSYEEKHVHAEIITSGKIGKLKNKLQHYTFKAVSYTHLRAHETVLDLVCRLLLEKKKKQ